MTTATSKSRAAPKTWTVILLHALDRPDLVEAVRNCGRDASAHNVHAVRVAARRLMAVTALATAATAVESGKMNRALRRVLRAASDVRDADVQLKLIADLGSRSAELAPWVASLRRRRRRAARRMRKKLHPRKTDRHLQALRRKISAAERCSSVAALRAFARSAAAVLRALEAAGIDDEQLHETRIASKQARYMAEALLPLRQTLRPAIQGLRALQRTLGRIHDLDTLQRRVVKLARERDADDPGAAALRRAIARRREVRCRRYLAQRATLRPVLRRLIAVSG